LNKFPDWSAVYLKEVFFEFVHQEIVMIVPKNINTFCSGNTCQKHQPHTVTQSKPGMRSPVAQGERTYHRKQQGSGGQTKPIFRKKAKVTKNIVLKLTCTNCKRIHQTEIGRMKHLEITNVKK
jgi:large subunit ribosomal protein L44e